MGGKIKISITGEKLRQPSSVCIALLFSPCLLEKGPAAQLILEKVANALTLHTVGWPMPKAG